VPSTTARNAGLSPWGIAELDLQLVIFPQHFMAQNPNQAYDPHEKVITY
jgi:hypothetical protein